MLAILLAVVHVEHAPRRLYNLYAGNAVVGLSTRVPFFLFSCGTAPRHASIVKQQMRRFARTKTKVMQTKRTVVSK